MLKSALMRMPPLYEFVQRIRDRRFFEASSERGSFAQHGEDREILRRLSEAGASGPYVDVGCNHPFRLSNTYLLYSKGWRGMCIDPLPRFEKLYRKWRPEDKFCRTAIGLSAGELPFYEFESDVLSTLDAELAGQYIRQGYRLRQRSSVTIATLDQVLKDHQLDMPLSLLSVDIEGHEVAALQSIDLQRWQPALICLEVATADGRRNDQAVDYLRTQRYEVTADMGINLLLSKSTHNE
jgi:FkbM family methyltransferase